MIEHRRVTAVIPAAGASSRMGGANKLLLPLREKPVLAHTLGAFAGHAMVDGIILCCRPQDQAAFEAIIEEYAIKKIRAIVRGGGTRAESVQKGVALCGEEEIVAIHDGARPLVAGELITRTICEAAKWGAAAPVVPVKDSIKEILDGIIAKNIDRGTIAAVQTPQVFQGGLIQRALSAAIAFDPAITDDCTAVERIGALVQAVPGDYSNLKITTPDDLALAEVYLKRREQGECVSDRDMTCTV